MPYLENNTVQYKKTSSSCTRHSYKHRGVDYSIPEGRGDHLFDDNINHSDLWNNSTLMINKPRHISKLRSILSETIANITKDRNLKKGESVELTLEIELMRSANNTPTNSLMEITIIQHNKAENKECNTTTKKILADKMPFHVEIKSSESLSASQKRRNWFQRVINRQFEESNSREKQNIKNSNINKYNRWKMKGNPFNFDKNNMEIEAISRRNKFITVLPEEIPITADFTKGYHRVSPRKKSPINTHRSKKPRNIMTTSKKDSLVKKLSDIFLPPKKSEKSKAVETALTALKHEVDNMKVMNKQVNNKNRAPVHNLGKLVSNILVDVLESSENTNIKTEAKSNFVPVAYKKFFEPVSKQKKENKSNQRETDKSLSLKQVTKSYSDTCFMQPTQDKSQIELKPSTSDSDCRVLARSRFTQAFRPIIDSNNMKAGKNNKPKKNKHSRKSLENEMEKKKSNSNHKISNKKSKHQHSKRATNSKKSLVEWNGQKIQINKGIKEKIEKLIVRELENLAIKEGMEYDVTPLPSTEDTSSNVEKISSFICELDIGDTLFKKEMKRKKSRHSKINIGNTHSTRRESRQSSKSRHVRKNQNSRPKVTNATTPSNQRSRSKQEHPNTTDLLPAIKEIKTIDVEVKYLNANIKNWSAESNTIIFNTCEAQASQEISDKMTSFEPSRSIDFNEKAFSTGFVKKIKSNDSTWNNYLSSGDQLIQTNEKINTSQDSYRKLVTISSTKSMTNNYESSIEIELDIKDLELILKEAKQKQKAEKVLISATCKRGINKQRKTIKFTGKNSPSYTNQLLINASKRLEKYVKVKR